MSDLLISLGVPPDLVAGMISILLWSLAITLSIIAIFVLRLYLRSSVNKKIRSIENSPAISMMDIDQMRKRGLVSDEEFKSIRHALAEREVGAERRRQQVERERHILAEAAHDPEAARKLLAPELQNAPAAGRAAAPQAAPQAASPAARRGQVQAAPSWTASRPAPQATASQPAMTARPAGARPANGHAAEPSAAGAPGGDGNGNKSSELDLLLEKGAITLEEYDRLRAFFL